MTENSEDGSSADTMNTGGALMVVWKPLRRPVFDAAATLKDIENSELRAAWRVDQVADEAFAIPYKMDDRQDAKNAKVGKKRKTLL